MKQSRNRQGSLALFLITLVLVITAACASSSRTPQVLSQPIQADSDRVVKVGDLPADGGWRRLQCVNSQDCFLSSPNNLWRSGDGGKTWQMLHRAKDSHETIQKVWFLDNSLGWMATESRWYKSEDGGRSWTPFETSLSSAGQLSDVKFLNQKLGWIAGAALRNASREELGSGSIPNVPRYLLDDATNKVMTPIIYRTDDGGKTWTPQKLSVDLGNIEKVDFIDSEHGIALSGPDAFQTNDGGKKWIKVNDPRTCFDSEEDGVYEGKPSWAYSLDSSLQWLAFDDGRMLRTSNGGRIWLELQPCDQTRPVVMHFTSADRGYGLGSDGFLYETTNAGSQWLRIGDEKYDAMSFLDKNHIWLISDRGIFRFKTDY